MAKRMVFLLIPALVLLLLCRGTWAQDFCAEMGPEYRLLTQTEIKSFGELVLKVKSLLPVPDAARYVPDGASEASTMPFVAEAKLNDKIAGGSWPSGCFLASPYNTLTFGYDAKKTQDNKPSGKSKDPLAAAQAAMAIMENKVQICVNINPYPYLMWTEGGKVVEVRDQDGYNIEKTPDFLTWQTGDEDVTLNMIFGPRTTKESETVNADKPAKAFAPARVIELIISGPKAEVDLLKKKIDRKAFAALLGPVVK
jgi:hypothetical protein